MKSSFQHPLVWLGLFIVTAVAATRAGTGRRSPSRIQSQLS